MLIIPLFKGRNDYITLFLARIRESAVSSTLDKVDFNSKASSIEQKLGPFQNLSKALVKQFSLAKRLTKSENGTRFWFEEMNPCELLARVKNFVEGLNQRKNICVERHWLNSDKLEIHQDT